MGRNLHVLLLGNYLLAHVFSTPGVTNATMAIGYHDSCQKLATLCFNRPYMTLQFSVQQRLYTIIGRQYLHFPRIIMASSSWHYAVEKDMH
jgi:hypothetical protein